MHVRLDSIYDHRIAVNLNLQFTVPFLGRSFILISDVWRSCAGALLLLMKGSCGWQSRTWMSPAVKKDFLSTSRLIYPVDLWPSDAAEVSHRKMKRFCFLFFCQINPCHFFFQRWKEWAWAWAARPQEGGHQDAGCHWRDRPWRSGEHALSGLLQRQRQTDQRSAFGGVSGEREHLGGRGRSLERIKPLEETN